MTVVVAMVDPPRPGLVATRLAETSPLDERDAADLYAAMAKDLFAAAAASGGELLVNYRPADLLPDDVDDAADPEAAVRALAADALDPADLDDARFEVQVGSTFDARAGNAVTHLLESEDVQSAAVVRPNAPLLGRKDLDAAAMKLRRSEVVLGPSRAGRVAFAGFRETIDYTDAFETPAVETLTRRARGADLDVDFLETHVTVQDGDDLLTLLATVRARQEAGRQVPAHTAATLDDLGLEIEGGDDDPALVSG